ncbi:MAG: hypothetical protein SH819_12555 [Cytophagales bacterium]|nr:hypothetical protein [Cytophagales bacterium]
MIFFSIKEFFYKLNTIGFILLLLPLVVFVFLYLQVGTQIPVITDDGETTTLFLILNLVLVSDLTIVHFWWRARIRRIKGVPELANKMDGYFFLVVVRGGAYAFVSLLMAAGFYLTESIYFTGEFILLMILITMLWPTPASFSKQLGLRGSEHDMVLNNRDLPPSE